ncbi:MAG: protein translocase subunit SecD, partial [Marmoricola sp.]
MAKKKPRPGRTLLIFGLTIAVLYGLAAIGQTWKPRLGLDLEGGTRITLSAIPQGGAVTATKLKQAASIVDARVNGSGVSEAAVSTQGDRNIIVEIPGKNASSLVDAVKRTAQLRFRLVAGQPQTGTPQTKASSSASPSPSGKAGAKNKAGSKKTRVPKVSAATPKPRPAPFAKPKPTPKASAPAAPSTSAQPQVTQKGASVSDPLAWSANPGLEWLQKYAAYNCPTKKQAAKPVEDNADQPLITCDEKGLKFLLSAAVIEGTNLKSASYGTPQNGVGWVVNLGLKGEAKKAMADTSTAL